jgi:hypothetical protein
MGIAAFNAHSFDFSFFEFLSWAFANPETPPVR